MKLSVEQANRFYLIWQPLILFVNRKLRLVPEMIREDYDGPLDPNKVVKIRDALWKDDSLREEFIAQNPANLPPQDLAIVESWRFRRADNFVILKHLKKHSIFIAAKPEAVYGVVGIISDMRELTPYLPCYVSTVLLPFEGQIIYDSLISHFNITFGRGYRTSMEDSFRDAKERGAIVTTLVPSKPASLVDKRVAAGETNALVLRAFEKELRRAGLSQTVVERDLENAANLATSFSPGEFEPVTLRNFDVAEVESHLARLHEVRGPKPALVNQCRTSLKRLIRFLRDTARMDFETAQAITNVLRDRQ